MMPNPKNNCSDSKNSTDPKNNNADQKNNHDLTKSNSTSRKDDADGKNNIDSVDNANSPPSQEDGDSCNLPHSSGPTQSLETHTGNKVYKSGPLFLSSKGIGWTSWKKRWFILTETSLVFFRSDPNASSGEANLTLGGIDLNSSGSVVVKADKKLITLLFPDGRSCTLKAETLDDLHEWKIALEEALENAPTAGTGPGISNADEQSKERSSPKSTVLGRPVLLALEDTDGTPSFLEKALRYVEQHGIKVEGILRQAADVELVERRIREYEHGKTEFTAEEDGHVIGDCIKYVLRELPSSPVPASCCKALLQAYRSDRGSRVNCMRAAICETFPEPNRRLLQRILTTMEAVAANKDVNRMSVSAVAACMSPLLLRPLLAGEVEVDNMGAGDQLMQAAAAANHAQAIIITLLEEYDNIFGEGEMLSELYSDSDESGSESEELSDDDDDDYTSEDDSQHASNSSQDDTQHDTKAKKKMATDNIAKERDEILRLERRKAELMKKTEAETRHNSILKEELLSKKDALGERHLALEKEVARLKEELHRERELRKILEAGVLMSKKLLGSIDEKSKADLEDIEAQVMGLQQILDDLGKVKDKEMEHEASTTRKSKEEQSFPSKNHTDKGEAKRSNSRGEATNSNSTLSKITNRLSFLKDKLNPMANESETIDNQSLDESGNQDSSSHNL